MGRGNGKCRRTRPGGEDKCECTGDESDAGCEEEERCLGRCPRHRNRRDRKGKLARRMRTGMTTLPSTSAARGTQDPHLLVCAGGTKGSEPIVAPFLHWQTSTGTPRLCLSQNPGTEVSSLSRETIASSIAGHEPCKYAGRHSARVPVHAIKPLSCLTTHAEARGASLRRSTNGPPGRGRQRGGDASGRRPAQVNPSLAPTTSGSPSSDRGRAS